MTPEQEKQALFLKEKLHLQSILTKKLKQAARLQSIGEQTLQDSLKWETLYHEGRLLQSQFYRLKKGDSEVLIPDWENENKDYHILLDPRLDPQSEVEKRFQKSKKLRRGVNHAHRLIKKAEDEIRDLSQMLEQLASIQSTIELEQFQQQHRSLMPQPQTKAANPVKALPYREFHTTAGLTIWVGKSAKDNDALTFSFAKGSDWWLHVRNVPGSHVILRCGKNQEPDQNSIEEAAQLAIAYSKAKDRGEAEVCLTQCKFVTRYGKGQAGKVHVSKHRIIHATFDKERFQIFKERNRA